MAEETDQGSPQTLDLDTSKFRREVSEADRLGKGLASSLSRAFVDVAVSGRSLGDVVGNLSQRLARLAVSSALKPLEQGFGDLFKSLSSGFGSLFSNNTRGEGGEGLGGFGSVTPFANGGIISSPTYFPTNGGLGLAGEAGSEAILPLGRGADGNLGVRGLGSSSEGANITINIQTPDVEGFRRSEAEIAATLARLVGRGQRGL